MVLPPVAARNDLKAMLDERSLTQTGAPIGCPYSDEGPSPSGSVWTVSSLTRR